MSANLTESLTLISLLTIACIVIVPVLWWVLPSKDSSSEEV